MQQADTGTKMIHLGKNTKSRIVSKGISAGRSQNTYRGQVSVHPKSIKSRNFTQCDSLLIGDQCGAHTVPYIDIGNSSSKVEHEATTSKIDEEKLFYCMARGLTEGKINSPGSKRFLQRSITIFAHGVCNGSAETGGN